MPEEYVETYLGCDIYYYTPPTVAYEQYGSPCLVSNYVTLTAVKKRICLSKGGSWVDGICILAPPAEFRFDSYNPPLDMSELFPTKTTAIYKEGESVYVHYAVINIGTVPGAGTIEVKDLDTGAVITTYNVPELPINGRFKTSGSGAYVGKMPNKDWRLEFKVMP